MQVYPNPVLEGENINLSFKTSYLGKAEVMVFNNSGQRRKIESIQVRSGLNLISIDIKNLLKGTYYIKLVSSDGKQIGSGKQFIKN